MRYELFYWPSIQGRGEFIRLAFEDKCADYIDVAREDGPGLGVEVLMRLLDGPALERPPFAPPFIRAGRLVIAQTAQILNYLGPRLGLVPKSESGRLWAHQLQLTLEDFIGEIHGVHHPIASSLYFHQQQREARRRAQYFTTGRAAQFLGYFENVLACNRAGSGYMIGRSLTYVDLSMFQLVAGLRYALPGMMARLEPEIPGLAVLHERVAQRPAIAAYLESGRRIPFNEDGIFRHYPELDN